MHSRIVCRFVLISILIGALLPSSAVNSDEQSEPHAAIAIHFHLDRPALVTLVIEDDKGQRVRNLVSETPFAAGDNVAWWDGLDDLGRDTNSAAHFVYYVPGKVVTPGTYIVRGLYHQKIDLKYEFAVYNPGQPPWKTSDTSSEWLTNHTPASAVCFIPAGMVPVHGERDLNSPSQVLIGSYVAEGGSGLAWLDLDGNKLHGQMWVGGVWTGAQELARDLGNHPLPGVYAYIASSWNGELRLRKLVKDPGRDAGASHDDRFGDGEDRPVLASTWKFPKPDLESVGGLAAYDGLVVVSLPKMDLLLFIDAANSRIIGNLAIPAPTGLFANNKGNLFVISGKQILKTTLPDLPPGNQPFQPKTPQPFITEGLEHPQRMITDAKQNLYVSDWGRSNQVKTFSPSGKFLGAVGSAGIAEAGPYDPKLMHHPKGITIDDRNQLWVAEEDFQPKRVSVWTLGGNFLRAFYGPATYGGGGNLDPKDKTLFYLNGMTFQLDWHTGESRLVRIHYRPKEDGSDMVPEFIGTPPNAPFQERGGRNKKFGASEGPDFPLYFGSHKYFTNAYNTDPTTGTPVVGLWIDRSGVAVPAAAFGRADAWRPLQDAAFLSRTNSQPSSLQSSASPRKALSEYTFIWSDLNGNGVPEPEEVSLAPVATRTVTISEHLEYATDAARSYSPTKFTREGIPIYDLNRSHALCPDTQKPASSGGGQVLATATGWTVLTTAPKPFAPQSLAGAEGGRAKWSYPSLWPGLHASHGAPVPDFPGELIGTTRLLGPSFQLRDAEDISLWAINGNKGSVYLFTTDGMFVSTLLRDSRLPGSSWAQQTQAVRGMDVSGLTGSEENFWPSITQTEQGGEVFLVTDFPAILRVEGLDTIRRIPPQKLEIRADVLEQARAFSLMSESSRRQHSESPSNTLSVPISVAPLKLDGDLSLWNPKQFVTIDERSNQGGNWGQTTIRTEAALRVGGDRLYAALRTGDPRALENSGRSLQNLFKTGGGLDLMLSTNPNSDPKRKSPAPGDIRLLVSLVKSKPVAILYRPVAITGPRNRTTFASPLRTLAFDDVEDVSQYVQLVEGPQVNRGSKAATGDFEFSIPLQVLNLKPLPGTTLRGDIGLLRGDGLQTTQRVYWSNKASGLVSDVPSEAELTPQLWGTLKFVSDSNANR